MNKMLINKLYIINFSLNKVFIREINNEYLKKALSDLTNLNINKFKLDKDINIALEKVNDLESQQAIKQVPLIYEDILKNLEESEKILNNVKDNLNIAKENSLNITLELKDNINNIKDIKVDGLNKEFKNIRDINNADINTKKDIDILNIDIQSNIETSNKFKKDLFNIE
jgi:hypothetical protein